LLALGHCVVPHAPSSSLYPPRPHTALTTHLLLPPLLLPPLLLPPLLLPLLPPRQSRTHQFILSLRPRLPTLPSLRSPSPPCKQLVLIMPSLRRRLTRHRSTFTT
jgi:hypothetical protein